MNKKQLREAVNTTVDMVELVRHYYGVDLMPGAGTCCPFHDDQRKSAKFHTDNSLYCFTESKTFRPWDVFKLEGLTDEQLMQKFGHLIGGPKLERPVQGLVSEKFFALQREMWLVRPTVLEVLTKWNEFVKKEKL